MNIDTAVEYIQQGCIRIWESTFIRKPKVNELGGSGAGVKDPINSSCMCRSPLIEI